VYCDAANVAAAKSIAVALTGSRNLPQAPDVVQFPNEEGIEFFR
jgi:hypothetical protein